MLALHSGIEPDRWLDFGDRTVLTAVALLADEDDPHPSRTYPEDMPPLSG